MKHILTKLKFKYFIIFLIILYLALILLPFIYHKKVSLNYQQNFSSQSFYHDSTGSERVAYITKNTDALQYRLHMIEEAKEEIVLSTYDFNCDESGKDMMAALLNAADRGVSVKLIVDGISGFIDIQRNSYFKSFVNHHKIELKIYNPINLCKPWTIQARLHDKYLIIDNSMYLLGGRNTMDLFLGDYSERQNIDREIFVYIDTQIPQTEQHINLEQDNSLMQLRHYFEAIWNLPESERFQCHQTSSKIMEYQKILRERYQNLLIKYPSMKTQWNYNDLTMATNKITLLSNPIAVQNKEPQIWYSINQMMQSSSNIKIYTPYIILGREMYHDLENICKSSESVELITNDIASGANPWGCTDYLNEKEKIWNMGIQVYEFLGAHSNHTKAILLDDRLSLIGSYNLDMRSTYLNTELMVVIDCPALNTIIEEEFEHDKTYSKTMTASGEYQMGKNYEPVDISNGKNFFYGILRILILPIRNLL